MLLPELRAEVARYARKMYDSQLVRASQGNISARDPQSGLICIKPSGIDYELLTAEDIVVIDEHGNVIEGKWGPSTETPLHTLILRRRHDIHCVMHTHSFYASAFSVVHKPVPVILAESASCLGGEVPVTPYKRSGTTEFAGTRCRGTWSRLRSDLGQPRCHGRRNQPTTCVFHCPRPGR